ncbi:MAG: hypothetical protein GY757_55835 [bacterium]|nr:hypothetical protein [bacterium]
MRKILLPLFIVLVIQMIVPAMLSGAATVELNRSSLYFSAMRLSSVQTPTQQVIVSNGGDGTLQWSASDNGAWLSISNIIGVQSGVIAASIDPQGLAVGTYSCRIAVEATNTTSSRNVLCYLTIIDTLSDAAPFGNLDAPINNSTVNGSVPITGWVLDDIATKTVKIYHGSDSGVSYIGDAIMVDGARPDVSLAYPTTPLNYKAGWGYMLLTHFLPNNGNGTYKIYVLAKDESDHEVLLGTTTIICDNAGSSKPFGAIDTPAAGEEIRGDSYRINGWALTPMPNMIPEDGSTIYAYIDGVSIGNVSYNYWRDEITTLFPNYYNSLRPHGLLYFDTTEYTNASHTVSWVVTDNGGNAEGIGSRYFNIQNSGYVDLPQSYTAKQDKPSFSSPSQLANLPLKSGSLYLKKGFGRNIEDTELLAGENGKVTASIKELDRVELRLKENSGSVLNGYMKSGDRLMKLPVGSTIKDGVFYWQPGVGFIGDYQFIFVTTDADGRLNKQAVDIKIKSKF